MSFSYYKTFTTDHTQCGASDSTDFPICINVVDVDLKTVGNGGYVQNSNGYDIRPYADSLLTAPLTFELVYYDPATGTLEMHTKVATLNHLSDVIYYLAFGDSGISSDGSSSSTWTAYAAVYHFPNGSSLTVKDSVGSYNGTNHGATATSGQIDGAAHFDGNTQYVSASPITALDSTQHFSMTGWYYIDSASTLPCPFSDGVDGGDYPLIIVLSGNSANWLSDMSASGADNSVNYDGVVPATTFTKFDVVYDGTLTGNGNRFKLYKNGSQQTETNSSGTIPSTSPSGSGGVLNIGRQLTSGGIRYWLGKLEEIRVSPSSLSADWLLAEYNNQKTSSTFLSWGSRTPFAPSSTKMNLLPLLGVG